MTKLDEFLAEIEAHVNNWRKYNCGYVEIVTEDADKLIAIVKAQAEALQFYCRKETVGDLVLTVTYGEDNGYKARHAIAETERIAGEK